MEVTVNSAPPSFQPISVQLKLETEEELHIFTTLMRADIRVPRLFEVGDACEVLNAEQRSRLGRMMRQLHNGLRDYIEKEDN